MVPVFAYSLAIWFRADWRSRDIVVMVIVASAGYAVNFFVSAVSPESWSGYQYLPFAQQLDESNVSAAAAAFTIGWVRSIVRCNHN